MSRKNRDGGGDPPSLPTHHPFRALLGERASSSEKAGEASEEAVADEASSTPAAAPEEGPPDRGRVDVVRQTARRGGKSVIVVSNFRDTSEQEKRELARRLRKACGTGGTVKNGSIEIQGEKRDEVKRVLEAAGYRPVFAGG